MKTKITFLSLLVIAVLLLSACGAAAPSAEDRLQVLATTSIVADVVQQVGGDYVNVTLLLPLGTDPHTFEPRPEDAVALAETQIVFANGAGLEEFLEPLLESTGAADKVVEVSAGIELLALEEHHHEGEEHEGEEHEGDEHHHEGGDPHTWIDPNNVIVWAQNIAAALSEADPAHAGEYQANAEAYIAELQELDAWICDQVAQVPAERRKLVTDHLLYGYFAEEYGLEQVGALVGSFSTAASPSAQELAALEDLIRAQDVPAIFVSMSANSALADQVANDTGIQVVRIYTGSLSEPGGEADSYLAYMRYNVTAIVEALK